MGRRLNEMEPLLAQSKRPSPLDQHVHDLSPTEAKVVEDYFARIRAHSARRASIGSRDAARTAG